MQQVCANSDINPILGKFRIKIFPSSQKFTIKAQVFQPILTLKSDRDGLKFHTSWEDAKTFILLNKLNREIFTFIEKLERSKRRLSSRNLKYNSPIVSPRGVELRRQSQPTLKKIKLNISDRIYGASAFSSPNDSMISPSEEKE